MALERANILFPRNDTTVVGKGVPTFTKFTTAFRTFTLVGKGDLSGSRIAMPIDEVPSGEGGGTIIVTVGGSRTYRIH